MAINRKAMVKGYKLSRDEFDRDIKQCLSFKNIPNLRSAQNVML